MTSTLIFLLGLLTGAVLAAFVAVFLFFKRKRKETIGTLQIIDSPNESPYMFLSLSTDIDSFARKPAVLMNVSYKQLSHK